MLKLQKQLFIYEDANIKISNPTNDMLDKMFEGIGEIQEDLEIDNLENAKILHYIGNRIVIPLIEEYDIASLTEEEFEELYNNADKYGETVKNMFIVLRSCCLDILLHYYKEMNLQLKEKELELQSLSARNKMVSINAENERIQQEILETKKKQADSLKLSRRERRRIDKEIKKKEKEIISQHTEWSEEDRNTFLGKYKNKG